MSDIWSWNNAVDAAGALVSSPQGGAGDLLTSNIRDPRVGKIWRAGATPATLNIQLPTSGDIAVFGIFGHNFADIGTVTLKLGTTAGAGDLWQTSFDAAEVGRQAVFVLLDAAGDLAPVEAPHATVETTTGAALEIGRVWLGTADWKSSYGHSIDGSGWGATDLSRKSVTPRTGAVLGDRGEVRRNFTATYDTLEPSEYGSTLFEMDARGILQQMLFVPNPAVYDPHRSAVLGTLNDIPATNWRAHMTTGRAITIQESG